MGESALHMLLTRFLVLWIAENLLGGDLAPILVDAPDQSARDKPPLIYNFVPDVYVMRGPNNGVIVGEAKTAKDVDARHSIEQYKAFLRKCSESDDSYFILAVPWDMVRLARWILGRLKKEIGAEEVVTTVLDRLPGSG